MVWYYARGGQRQGPVEDAEIQQLAASGQIAPGDLVWRSGLPDWRPAGEVPEIARFLRPAAAAAPPPPPPPPVSYQPASLQTQAPAPYVQAPAPYAPPPSPYAPPSAPLTQSPAYGPAPLPVPATTPSLFGTVASTTEYASFILRLGAFIIDQIIVLIAALILGFVLGILMAVGGSVPTGEEAIWNIVGVVITWLYYAGFESSSLMGTPGKRALGLRVTDMQGQRINFVRATGRHFGKIISAVLLLVGFLMMIFDDQKQTLHDKLASCLVLKQR